MTHFELLEADLSRYYQTDLPTAVWGPEPISVRRFRSLVRGLPPDGALGRALSPHPPGWGNVEELLATTVELVDLGNRILHAAYCEPPHPGPIKLTRPTDTEPERPAMATSEEMLAFFKRTGGI